MRGGSGLGALAIVVSAAAGTAFAQPATETPAAADKRPVIEAPTERSDLLPVGEILGFQFLLNRFDRAFVEPSSDYRVTWRTIRHNLHSSWRTDNDPFKTNQAGHPYQGATYYGFARSTGHNYWESLGYAFAGSAVWEIAGEATPPSRNDQVASGIGGTFLGEALYRMSNLVLEQGGGLPRFWREVAAAAIAPSAGVNRFAYGDRFGAVLSSHDAAYFSRLMVGGSGSVKRDLGSSTTDFKRGEALVDFSIDYGLPGRPDYAYRHPFDYFNFQMTASSANVVENVLTRGLLVGEPWSAGQDWRGVWGIYGSYDYIAPQAFRISTTALSIGSTAQAWLSEMFSLQGTALLGAGYAAVGTTRGTVGQRDYNYGLAPHTLLALRLTYGDRASLDLSGREYFVSRVASGTNGGHDNIVRGDAAFTYRIARQQALTLRFLSTRRDATFASPGNRKQVVSTVGVFYTLLGQDRFGTVDWR